MTTEQDLLRRLVESQERMERMANRPGCLEFTPRGCGCILALLSPLILLAILAKMMPWTAPPNPAQESQWNAVALPPSVYGGFNLDAQSGDVVELIGPPGQNVVKFHLSPREGKAAIPTDVPVKAEVLSVDPGKPMPVECRIIDGPNKGMDIDVEPANIHTLH